MYQYIWDEETGGLLLTTEISKFSKEPRPVYYRELDLLGFDQYWDYPKDDSAPIMWAEANNYIYRGRVVAKTKGGSYYQKPEIVIVDEPEPEHTVLRVVDIDGMIQKNASLMETLAQETIQKVYNTYVKYKDKIDVFYVAFSGGKDSVVALDIVQKALPHDDFLVLFGDTRMEFSDTYKAVEDIKEKCKGDGIEFYTSRSDLPPEYTWSVFGPPSTVSRWCCSVHKTAPQILMLRELTSKPNFTGMAFVGVRADESVARSKYDYVSFGEKHKGQYSCNVILEWSSAEVFLYIYMQKLVLNEAYKKGNRRAGCLVCPRAAERSDYMNHSCYCDEAEPLVESIRCSYANAFQTKNDLEHFIEVGGWKARKNGRDITIPINYTEQKDQEKNIYIQVKNPRTNWREWIKTIGILSNESSPYTINFRGSLIQIEIIETEDSINVKIKKEITTQYPDFVKHIKNVFRKTACCVGCRECQADCPYGCIDFHNGQVSISENCKHCSQCHKAEKGCLVYKSLEMPKGGIIVSGKNMSLNSYSHHAPKMDWFKQYFEFKNEFDEKHGLGSQMFSFFKRFLRDAELLDLVNAALKLGHRAKQHIVLIQFAVTIGIGINLEYRTRELVVWIVLIHLCQPNVSTDAVVDKGDFHNLVHLADIHGDFFLGEYKAFRAFDFTDNPSAIRYFLKRKTTVLCGYGSRNRCFLGKFSSASLKDADCRTAQSVSVLIGFLTTD